MVYGHDKIKSSKDKKAYNELSRNKKVKAIYDNYINKDKEVTTAMRKAIKNAGMKSLGLEYSLKQPASFYRKIQEKANEKGMSLDKAADSLNDVLRYTGVSSAKNLVKSAKKTLDSLKAKGYKVLEIKNSWLIDNKENPYNGINCKLMDKDGTKLELQFHTPQSFDMKERKQHKWYEISRDSSLSPEQRKEADAKMIALIEENPKWRIPDDIDKI